MLHPKPDWRESFCGAVADAQGRQNLDRKRGYRPPWNTERSFTNTFLAALPALRLLRTSQ
jgi:hypothetical protein